MHQAEFWLESKYVTLLSGRLDLFKNKGNHLYNFRCPLCGDSQKNKFKARGYLFGKEGTHIYKCHNCGAAVSFNHFLKDVDPNLYSEFMLEKMAASNTAPTAVGAEETRFKTDMSKFEKRRHDKFGPLKDIKKISQLRWDHPAKLYVDKRMLPNWTHSKLYYAPKFNRWINKHWPGKMSEKAPEEPRLVIPFFDEKGYVFGVQGRSFSKKSNLRYITILFSEREKIFGLERVNTNKTYFIVEGPLDSLFLRNAIAMAGADLKSKYTTDEKAVFAYDNEPRNPDIIRRMESRITEGKRVVIWPEEIKEKDINDMVLKGVDASHLNDVMSARTFHGLEAKLELNNWKKI